MVSHGQYKVGQAAAAVFNLLRRYARGRGRRHAFRQRTIELRQCRAGAGHQAGEDEKAKCKRQARPGFPCDIFHREAPSDGKNCGVTVKAPLGVLIHFSSPQLQHSMPRLKWAPLRS